MCRALFLCCQVPRCGGVVLLNVHMVKTALIDIHGNQQLELAAHWFAHTAL